MGRRLPLRFRALHEIERLLRGRTFVDDRANAANHADRVRGLPDVPTHVHAFRAVLDRVIGQLERVEFRLELRAARDDERDRARFDDLREIVAVVRLDEMGPELGSDPTGEAEVPRVAFLELLADRSHREDWDAGLLAFVDEFP